MNDVQLQVNGNIITGNDIFAAIDEVLDHVNATGDLSVAETALKSLEGIERVSGMAIAKLLSGLEDWWTSTDQEKITNDTFEDWVQSVSSNFKNIYIKRCISVYKKQELNIFSERICSRPVKDQQAIAGHLDQDYALDSKQWKRLERAGNNTEVLAILREAKGKDPRKHSLQIFLERDGSLNIWFNEERYSLGFLKPLNTANTEDERQALDKARNRILSSSGIIER